MSKELKKIIIAVVALALIGGAYFFVTSDKEAKKEAEVAAQHVYNDVNAKIVQIDIATAAESGSFVKDGVNWVMVGKEGVELAQMSLDQAATYAKTLTFEKKIEDGNPSDFGLVGGTMFTAISDDGKEFSVVVGDKVTGDAGYFAMAEGGIYVVSKETGDSLKKSASAYRNRYPEFVDYSALNEMRIYRKDKRDLVIKPNPNGMVEEGLGEYILVESFPCVMPVLTDALAANVGGPVYEIAAVSFFDEPEAPEVYGFDDPYMTINLTDTTGYACSIVIGDEASEGERYAQFSEKDYVCTVSTAKTDLIYNVDVFDIIGKYYVNDNLGSITSIGFAADGTETMFTVDAANGKIFKNNIEEDVQKFSQLFTKLTMLTIDGRTDDDFGTKVFEMDIRYADGRIQKVEFMEYNSNFYGVVINGEKAAVSGKKMMDEFINAVKNY